jgi:hypothetical protein
MGTSQKGGCTQRKRGYGKYATNLGCVHAILGSHDNPRLLRTQRRSAAQTNTIVTALTGHAFQHGLENGAEAENPSGAAAFEYIAGGAQPYRFALVLFGVGRGENDHYRIPAGHAPAHCL